MAELKKYTHDVFKQKDLLEYLTNEQTKHYMEISYAIMLGRMEAGKNPENHYLVCNTDEPYADRVRKAILDGEDEKAGIKPKCEYCEMLNKKIIFGPGHLLDNEPLLPFVSISYNYKTEHGIGGKALHANYCPNCGRELNT